MPYYICKAYNSFGKKSVIIEYAEDENELYKKASANGNSVISLRLLKRNLATSRIKKKDLLYFFGYIEQLSSVGIDIVEILDSLHDETRNIAIKFLAKSVARSIRSGKLLSEAMEMHGSIFQEALVGIIRTGERSNSMVNSYGYIVDHIRTNMFLTTKIRQAIAYPIVMICFVVGIFFFFTTFLIPKFAEFFKSIGDMQLPWYTLAVMDVSSFVQAHWEGMIILSGSAILSAIFAYLSSYRVRVFFARVILSVPLIGETLIKIDMIRFSIFFSIMIRSGNSIHESVDESVHIISNIAIREEILKISKIVYENGLLISKAMERLKYIPNFVVRMFRIGEDTGDITRSLSNISTIYKSEVETFMNNFVASIKPVSLMFVGLMLGIVAFATFGPIYTKFYSMVQAS